MTYLKTIPFINHINFDILKLIALVAMTLDHIGNVLFPGEHLFLRYIGRMAFPIFAFLIATHLTHNENFKKYILRLLPFAIITSLIIIPFEISYDKPFKLNILWTFLISICGVYSFKCIKKENLPKIIAYFFYFMTFLFMYCLSLISDYYFNGVCFILVLYIYLKTKKVIPLLGVLFLSFLLNTKGYANHPTEVITMSCIGFLTTLFLLTLKFNKPQRRFLKPWWLVYCYFPLHLVILYMIRTYM